MHYNRYIFLSSNLQKKIEVRIQNCDENKILFCCFENLNLDIPSASFFISDDLYYLVAVKVPIDNPRIVLPGVWHKQDYIYNVINNFLIKFKILKSSKQDLRMI